MNTVFLSIGSNLGNRFLNLQNAVAEIALQIGQIISISPIYESEPIGFMSADLFLNACIQVESTKSAFQILESIHEIETSAGRIRASDNGYISRILDIDIIFYNQETVESINLQVPHPYFQDRLFVLLPMNDLNAHFIDPKSMLTIKELLYKCTDNSKLAKIKLLLNF